MNKLLIGVVAIVFSHFANANSYNLISPLKASEYMTCWSLHYPNYTQVFGYSSLGHVFLRDPVLKNYIVLHPYKGAAKSYGEHDSIAEFERAVLKEDSFAYFVLDTERVAELNQRIGPPGEEEVFIPTPYPFIGGNESLQSYDKGNVWVMLSIVAELRGLCE